MTVQHQKTTAQPSARPHWRDCVCAKQHSGIKLRNCRLGLSIWTAWGEHMRSAYNGASTLTKKSCSVPWSRKQGSTSRIPKPINHQTTTIRRRCVVDSPPNRRHTTAP